MLGLLTYCYVQNIYMFYLFDACALGSYALLKGNALLNFTVGRVVALLRYRSNEASN